MEGRALRWTAAMVDEDDREALGAGATALVQSVAAVAAPALFGPLAAAMVQSVAGSPLASLSTFLGG